MDAVEFMVREGCAGSIIGAAEKSPRCRKKNITIYLVHREQPSRTILHRPRCMAWGCTDCVLCKSAQWVKHLAGKFSEAEAEGKRLWVLRCPAGEVSAVRQRIKRRGGKYVRILVRGGQAVMIADTEFPGGPAAIDAEQAREIAAQAIADRDPDEAQPVSSTKKDGGWQLPERGGKYRRVARGNDKEARAARCVLAESGAEASACEDNGDGSVQAFRLPQQEAEAINEKVIAVMRASAPENRRGEQKAQHKDKGKFSLPRHSLAPPPGPSAFLSPAPSLPSLTVCGIPLDSLESELFRDCCAAGRLEMPDWLPMASRLPEAWRLDRAAKGLSE